MEAKFKEIIWTIPAKEDLKAIYFFLAEHSISVADNLINKLKKRPEILMQTGFINAGQIDEFNPNYRHLIEGNYKILYTEKKQHIVINRVFDSRQNPIKMK